MNVEITSIELFAISIPLMLGLIALGGLVLDMTAFKKRPRAMGIYVFAGVVIVLFLQWLMHVYQLRTETGNALSAVAFDRQYNFDFFSAYFNYIFLGAAAFAAISSLTRFAKSKDHRPEYYILLVIAVMGMCMMAAANDLMILFIGLETMSISIYILVGIERRNLKSGEASMKYLLLGAFASAIMLYGMALVYGISGGLGYGEINAGLFGVNKADTMNYLVMWFGVAFLFTGLFFKIAAVPFHMWTPDVYEGAPTPITAFMATGVKAAAFAALLRLTLASGPIWGADAPLLAVLTALAILTMSVGNFVAIAQKNIKRMLAYSSIAHAGYLLVGLTALVASVQYNNPQQVASGHFEMARQMSSSSILFYLLAYTFMNLGAFGVIVSVSREKKDGETLEGFAGLGFRRPGLAAIMAICMLSLAGIPPMVGFAAKFYVFQSAIANHLYLLAIIGVLNSVVSAYYYLRVLVVMYMQPEKIKPVTEKELVSGTSVSNIVMASAVILLGLFPQVAIDLAYQVIRALETGTRYLH